MSIYTSTNKAGHPEASGVIERYRILEKDTKCGTFLSFVTDLIIMCPARVLILFLLVFFRAVLASKKSLHCMGNEADSKSRSNYFLLAFFASYISLSSYVR